MILELDISLYYSYNIYISDIYDKTHIAVSKTPICIDNMQQKLSVSSAHTSYLNSYNADVFV